MKKRDEFDSASSFITMSELMDELVLFAPTEHVEEVPTTFGIKDAIITDMVVLSREGQPVYEDIMILQGGLIGTLKRKLIVKEEIEVDQASGHLFKVTTQSSRAHLGVVGKGEAKKGQNAPFTLLAPTEEQKQMARDFLAEYELVRPSVVTRELVEQKMPQAPAADGPSPWQKRDQAPAVPVVDAGPDTDDPWAV